MIRAVLLLLGLAVGGCAPAPRAPADSPVTPGGEGTLVVGRVELVPPLGKGEQRLRGIGSGTYENLMLLLIDEQLRELPARPAIADYAGRIEARLGSHFFVRSDSRPFHILGGVLMLEVGPRMNQARFPGGFRVALRPGDRAVYIGTLRYHRDEFFTVTKVSVVDEHAAASADFKAKFGASVTLRKSLMTPAQ